MSGKEGVVEWEEGSGGVGGREWWSGREGVVEWEGGSGGVGGRKWWSGREGVVEWEGGSGGMSWCVVVRKSAEGESWWIKCEWYETQRKIFQKYKRI